MTQTPDLTPQDYQRIIATLNAQKAAAELAALEWQVRAENATAALAAQTTTEEATS
ncbi:hypothetical protein AABM36_08275 [Kocuria sp. KSNUG]|uniref:hypothetical protein n=1 Tax=Kocuria sp. KSNUG TaxID=3136676 RepID=UPI003C2E6950